MELVADADHHAAFGRAVELGDGERSDLRRLRELPCLFKGILSRGTVEHQHHLVRGPRDDLAHDVADFGQFVHQVDFVVQAACRVDQHHVGAVGLGRRQRVERHRCRVGTHLLTDHRRPGAVGPNFELVDGCGAERIGGADPDFQSGLGQLCRELADGGGLARAVDADDHHHVGFALPGVEPEMLLRAVRLLHQRHDLLAQDGLELGRIHVFVARHTLFDAPDNLHRGFHAHVRRNQHLLHVVQQVGIDRRAACYGTGEFREDSGLGLFEPRAELFLLLLPTLRNVRCGAILFLFENIEKSHTYIYIS